MFVINEQGRNMIRAEVGHEISLGCDFGNTLYYDQSTFLNTLYSIKWYRDDREFFRYIPTGQLDPKYFHGS